MDKISSSPAFSINSEKAEITVKTLRSSEKKRWKRCFSGWQRKKIQAAPLKDMSNSHQSINTGDEDEKSFRQTSVDWSLPVAKTKAKKSKLFLCFFPYFFSKNEKKMQDKEAKKMDKISSSPAFSRNSETAENTNIPVSGTSDQTAEDLDDLMHCDDMFDDKEITCPSIHPIISEDSISTCSSSWSSVSLDNISTRSSSCCSMIENGRMTDFSWCSSLDWDMSDMITSFDQNLDEEITKVCQSFCNPETMETEAEDSGEDSTTETGSTLRLSLTSEESMRSASCVSSSSTITAITEAGKMLVSYVIDEAVKALRSTDAAKTLQSTEAEETFSQTSVDLSPPAAETKKKKRNRVSCFYHIYFSKNEKKMQDKEGKKMEYTCPCTHPIISEDSISTCSSSWSSVSLDNISTSSSSCCSMSENGRMTDFSWCSSPDSDISDMITSFDQNLDEEITKVCQSFCNPENMETEAEDFGEDPTPETGSTLRLSIRTQENVRSASDLFDEAVKTVQSTDTAKTLQSTDTAKTLQSTEAAKTLQSMIHDEETFSQTSVDWSLPVAETKAKKSKFFFCFFPYFFSKNEKKMKEEEEEKR